MPFEEVFVLNDWAIEKRPGMVTSQKYQFEINKIIPPRWPKRI